MVRIHSSPPLSPQGVVRVSLVTPFLAVSRWIPYVETTCLFNSLTWAQNENTMQNQFDTSLSTTGKIALFRVTTFGEKLLRWRKELGLSQSQAAAHIAGRLAGAGLFAIRARSQDASTVGAVPH